jgi:hypothetical protein
MFHTPAHKHVGPNPPAQFSIHDPYNPPPVAFRIMGAGGNLVVLCPLTPEAREWCNEHRPQGGYGGTMYYHIGRRDMAPIYDALTDAGFRIEGE